MLFLPKCGNLVSLKLYYEVVGWLVGIYTHDYTISCSFPFSSSSASSIRPGVELGCKLKPIEWRWIIGNPLCAHSSTCVEWMNESDLKIEFILQFSELRCGRYWFFSGFCCWKFNYFFFSFFAKNWVWKVKISWFLKWVCFTLLNLENVKK